MLRSKTGTIQYIRLVAVEFSALAVKLKIKADSLLTTLLSIIPKLARPLVADSHSASFGQSLKTRSARRQWCRGTTASDSSAQQAAHNTPGRPQRPKHDRKSASLCS